MKRKARISFSAAAHPVLLCACLLLSPRLLAQDASPDFVTHIAPILAKHCTSCHNAEDVEGELNLETYEGLLKGGEKGAAIVAGKSAESRLIRLVTRQEKPYMPPGKRQSPGEREIALLRAWIDAGATMSSGAPSTARSIEPPQVTLTVLPRRPITAIAFAPAGDHVALGRDGEVEIYSVGRRETVTRLAGHRGKVMDLVFSSDGRSLVAGGGEPGRVGEAWLWRVDSRLSDSPAEAANPLRTFGGHADNLYAVAYGPDGAILATGSYDGAIRLREIETGRELPGPAGHKGAVFDLAFRPDGSVLASASADRTVKLWDVKSGERLDTLAESLKDLYTLAFSPDGGRLAAAGIDNRIRVWAISRAAREGTSPILYSRFAHESPIIALAYSPDGRTLVSAAEDRTVKVWEAETVTERFLLDAQPDWPAALAYSPDGRQVVVGRLDGTIGFYDVATGGIIRLSRRSGTNSSAASVALATLISPPSSLALLLAALEAQPPESAGNEAPPAKPELARLEPRGVARGVSATVRLIGKHLDRVDQVRFHHEKLAGKLKPGSAEAADDSVASETELLVEMTPAEEMEPGAYELSVVNAGGESNRVKVYIGDLPHIHEEEPNHYGPRNGARGDSASFWGTLSAPGDVDSFEFSGEAGATVVLDVEARRIDSKADVVLTILDAGGRVVAAGNDYDGHPDPLIAYTLPAAARYTARINDASMTGSADHYYRLSIGAFPYVSACFPLSVPVGTETNVALVGYNLPPGAAVKVQPEAPGEVTLPVDRSRFRLRGPVTVVAGSTTEIVEAEPNDDFSSANPIAVPSVAGGRIRVHDDAGTPDVDLFRFTARAGQVLVIETEAARRSSPIDTRIEVLDTDGAPVPRVLLEATRDSAITFRPIDSESGGARLDNWEEMQLNQYLYMRGDVCRLFRMPQGPDSQMDFYTRHGRRRNYFGTSATAHPLFEAVYIVEPHPPGTELVPNGLPTFLIDYANDDDSGRALGRDSRLLFTAPRDGDYHVCVTDVTGRGGDRYSYRLHVRQAKPDFTVRLDEQSPTIGRGSGKAFTVRAERSDGFDGEIRVDFTGVPPGFTVSTPLVIQEGHDAAEGTLCVALDAREPSEEDWKKCKVVATAEIAGERVTKDVSSFGDAFPPHSPLGDGVKIGKEPTLFVSLEDVIPLETRMKSAGWHTLEPTRFLAAGGTELVPQEDGSLLATGANPTSEAYTVIYDTTLRHIHGLRLEALSDPSLPEKGPGRSKEGGFEVTGLRVTSAPRGNPAAATAIALGESSSVEPHTYPFAEPIAGFSEGTTLTVTIEQHSEKKQHNLGRFKVSAKGIPAIERSGKPVELTIAPGTSVRAMLRVERRGHDDLITFAVGGLPHGVIVDNIGLSGVLIPAGEDEREIFLTAYHWVPETSRFCYAVAAQAGGPTSLPVLLHVRKPPAAAAGEQTTD